MTAGRLDAISGGWSVFWNELLDGSPANRHQKVAAAVTRTGKFLTDRSATARWFDSIFATNVPLTTRSAADNGNAQLQRPLRPRPVHRSVRQF